MHGTLTVLIALSDIVNQIVDNELLGRGVFSGKAAKRAIRSKPTYHTFLERQGVVDLSVDRLSVAPLDDATEIADRNAASRDATFYGWSAVKAGIARGSGRQVRASPISENPFHADIIFPEDTKDDRRAQIFHATELARNSQWHERAHEHKIP